MTAASAERSCSSRGSHSSHRDDADHRHEFHRGLRHERCCLDGDSCSASSGPLGALWEALDRAKARLVCVADNIDTEKRDDGATEFMFQINSAVAGRLAVKRGSGDKRYVWLPETVAA